MLSVLISCLFCLLDKEFRHHLRFDSANRMIQATEAIDSLRRC